MTFANLKPRDLVTFLIPSGIGRYGQEWKEKSGRIAMAFESHVVVNGGGRHGTPHVVDKGNFLKKGR